MDIRTELCFHLSRKLMRPPERRVAELSAYGDWRHTALSNAWSAFSDDYVTGKEVIDFGCGDGQLSLFLSATKHPRRIVGIDINPDAIDRARAALKDFPVDDVEIDFMLGDTESMPLPDCSADTLVAFDCLEHVMSIEPIFLEWHRVLHPGGHCLINWYPYKGPWGPHMESLIPIPWAHVLFGERAMFRAAEKIYDLPEFVPRHWDLDSCGNKKPNKWHAWSSFEEQGYINRLDIRRFQNLAHKVGFEIVRLDKHSFSGAAIRRLIGRTMMRLPLLGEYFVSYAVIELRKNSVVSDHSGVAK